MKKIFVVLFSVLLVACKPYIIHKFPIGNERSLYNEVFEVNSEYFWGDNFRSYKLIPIRYFDKHNCVTSFSKQDELINAINYKKNVDVYAEVNQDMYISRTFEYHNATEDSIVANNDGTVENSLISVKLKKGDILKPIGEVNINHKYYLLFDPQDDGNILIADDEGQFFSTIGSIYKSELLIPKLISPKYPKDLGIKNSRFSDADYGEPVDQFKIIYAGSTASAINIKLVEFNDGKEAGTKMYTYPPKPGVITINGVKMQILEVRPEKINFRFID